MYVHVYELGYYNAKYVSSYLIRTAGNYPKKTQLCPNQLQKFNGRRHDLVNRYGIYLSQMTTDMCHLS